MFDNLLNNPKKVEIMQYPMRSNVAFFDNAAGKFAPYLSAMQNDFLLMR